MSLYNDLIIDRQCIPNFALITGYRRFHFRCSSVIGIATRLRDGQFGVQIPNWVRGFLLFQNVQICPYSVVTGVFPGG